MAFVKLSFTGGVDDFDLFFSSKEEGFFENRKNIFNAAFQGVNFWEKMEHDVISENGIVFYDYAKIATLNAIQIGFDWVTRLCGSLVLFVRNHTFRAIQDHMQRIDIENMCSDPNISSISSALPPVGETNSSVDKTSPPVENPHHKPPPTESERDAAYKPGVL